MKHFKTVLLGLAASMPAIISAQTFLPKDSVKTVKFKTPFAMVQNQNYFVLGSDASSKVRALNGTEVTGLKSEKWVLAPMLGGYVLHTDGKNVRVRDVLSADGESNDKKLFKSKKMPVSNLAYSPDGTYVLIATSDSTLIKCTTAAKDKERTKYALKVSAVPTKILINKAANTALSINGKSINVVNTERGNVRKVFNFDSPIADVAYSNDCYEFAVMLSDGTLKVIESASLKERKSYQIKSSAKACKYLLQGKYIVIAYDDSYDMLNLLTSKVDYIVSENNSNFLNMDVFFDSFMNERLVYFSQSDLSSLPLSMIERYHTMDLKRELDLRMAEWSKMLPGESESDYRSRVNDETRAKYALQLERELVTGMAGNMLESDNAKFGNYFEGNQALAIDFSGMPSIYLNIPSDDLKDLKTIDDLEFFNTVYGLTDDDKFEVIYTEARNKNTGKVYIYDNLSRKSMAFDQDSFVPMEVVQLASIEAAKLEKMKEEVMTAAKNENILTDHTKINVATEVEQDIDADGNKILNYKVNYMYEVEEDFSARDDFKAGKYNTAESNAAVQMMNIIKNSLQGDFAKYLTDSKKMEVSITGSADAIPIVGTLAYKNEYGDIIDQLVYENNELTKMTVTKASGIKSNQQLALVRAVGVADYMSKNIVNDIAIPADYKYFVEVSEEKGGKFRRIKVTLKFIDAFKKQQ